MMVSEYCVEGSFLGNLDKGSCSYHCREQGFLEDRKKEKFPLKQDQFGRMHVLNGHPLSMLANVPEMEKTGIARLRIDGRDYTAEELGELTALYRGVLDGDTKVEENRTTYNIIGELPGQEEGVMLLLSAHYDSYFNGFQDDNAAAAMVLGIARTLIRSGYKPARPFCLRRWRRKNGESPIPNMTGLRERISRYL